MRLLRLLILLAAAPAAAHAQDHMHGEMQGDMHAGMHGDMQGEGAAAPAGHAHHGPDAHAPIGVMGDHTHNAGEFMFAYSFMHMEMSGSRSGTDGISPETIVTTVPNRFAGAPGQPATLRVAPLKMQADMHMMSLMYAPADWVTLMAGATYLDKDMTHRTYQGGAGTNALGEFGASSSGFGDASLSGLFPIRKGPGFSLSASAGVSLPTGSTSQTGQVLTPMNTRVVQRLPYAMQLGSGTWDLLPGFTVKGRVGGFGWGAQYQGVIRTGTNDEGYRLGDRHMATIWADRVLAPWISVSARLAAEHEDAIHGIDPAIAAPVQTADPDNYGGDRATAYLGANFLGTGGAVAGYRLGVELGVPLYQKLNGPQLENDWTITVGLQKAF